MTPSSNETLERIARRIPILEPAYERMLRRRDRKRRNQRITAGVVGIAVFVAAVWIVRDVASLDRSEKSVIPGGSSTTGPAETGPAAPVVAFQRADYLLDLDTGETTPLPKEIRGDWQNGYAVSPDGSEVAYYGLGQDGGMIRGEIVGLALFVAHIDGTQVRQIADGAFTPGGAGSSEMGPAWSPDGTKIAYVGSIDLSRDIHSNIDEVDSNIFVVDLASGVTTQVTFETVRVSGAAFSPDGSSIVYTALLPGGSEVRIAPATGGEGSTLVGGHGSSASGASFSPDGSLLSYVCGPPFHMNPWNHRDLCLANADGSHPRVIVQAGTVTPGDGIPTASWSPDGSRLAYWTFWGVEGVYILDLATGQTRCVAGCRQSGVGAWPPQAWPRWLDDHSLFVEAYNGPH